MTPRVTGWTLGFLALVSTLFLGGCKTLTDLAAGAAKPGLSVKSVRFGDVSTSGLTLIFDTEVTNPYGVDLPLVNLEYSLASSGATFLTGSAPIQGTVPAKGAKVVALPAKVDFSRMFSVLQTVKPGSVLPYAASMKLAVDGPSGVGRLSLPLNRSGELPVPAVPDVSVSGIGIGSLSLGEAKATLALSVKNTNQFALTLARMGFGLDLAGSRVSTVAATKGLALKPGETGTIEIPITLSLSNLGISAFNALRGKDTGYRLSGDMTLETPFGPMNLPLDRGGTTSVRN
ncbi:MAG: hypothetical protein HEQ23_13860 [Tepidisphaera sp.]